MSAAAQDPAPRVEVRRSARRRRTVSAYRDGELTVVLLPARMSVAEERRWVALMLDRLSARDRRAHRNGGSDEALLRRAGDLAARYLPAGVRPATIRWVGNQRSRWGSCTPADASIRLSTRLRQLPAWVVDYVIVHELAHLVVAGHDDSFWALVARYPRAERARGYLEGVAAASGLAVGDADDDAAGSEAHSDAGRDRSAGPDRTDDCHPTLNSPA